MKKSVIVQSVALACLGVAGSQALAVGFSQNDINLDINGTVNGFYINRETKSTSATGVVTKSRNSAVSNGLLPGWINFVMTTKAEEQDIKAHFSFAPGINSNSQVIGLPIGNNAGGAGTTNPYSQIDTRNLYLQFGNGSWGSVKAGRDIGLFGQHVILSDMTLLGVGGTSNAGIPYNTTFGMIGHGYMYTGFQPQITYTTPNKDGLQASAGIFQPSKFAGDQTKTPGFQAMGSYDWKGNNPGKVWMGGVSQNTSCSTGGTCTTQSFNAQGVEAGVKMGFGAFEALAYGFAGNGLGQSTVGAQFYNGSNGASSRTKSQGYFLQGTYTMGKTKVGLNFGENRDKDGVALTGTGTSNQIKNRAYTLGVYHSLNKFITLVGEINQEKITNTNDTGAKDTNTSVSLGAVLFF